jgi:two-component system chemotaxis response regulator CheB
MDVLLRILAPLPADFPIPLLIVQHLHKTDHSRFAAMLDASVPLSVTEAMDEQVVEPAHVYVAPSDYHVLVERDGTLALSVDPPVNWSRPSVDVLFESAARTFAERLIGVLLTGANADGARGLKLIRQLGGLTIAQDPATAESPVMPEAAIRLQAAEQVLSPDEIADRLLALARVDGDRRRAFARSGDGGSNG